MQSREPLSVFTLRNRRGSEAIFTSRGAALVRLRVLGADVVLGFPDPARYDAPHPYLGVIAGRHANRIARGRFALDGRGYTLPCNDGEHHLHGGPDGLARKIWESESDANSVRFRVTSPDGDQGYPGALEAEVIYSLGDDDALRIELRARSDRATIVNLTSHAYWNLRDGGASPILDHELWLDAHAYLPVDAAGIPTGELCPARGTPFDFTRQKALGARIEAADQLEHRGGYDHCFVLCGSGLRRVARLYDPHSGRALEIETTQPGVQLYTGNSLDGSLVGHGGAIYRRFHGLCLETQAFPDAPNHARFPATRLDPGVEYAHTTVYRVTSDQERGKPRMRSATMFF
jgi:aldose 1-epimerase